MRVGGRPGDIKPLVERLRSGGATSDWRSLRRAALMKSRFEPEGFEFIGCFREAYLDDFIDYHPDYEIRYSTDACDAKGCSIKGYIAIYRRRLDI